MSNRDEHSDPGYEHERKFIVEDLAVTRGTIGEEIEQGYLWRGAEYAVRVRRTKIYNEAGEFEDGPSMLTIKGPRKNNSRLERETEIPTEDAIVILAQAEHVVRKTRYQPIVSENETWIVDVFHGKNEGLVIAEYEAFPEAVAKIKKPWWCSEEVTNDVRYSNDYLAFNPWTEWGTPAGS